MKSIVYTFIIFNIISCTKRVITETRYQEILEQSMHHLPELVNSVDYEETIKAIQKETFELFGITKEATTIQDALRNYYYADLTQVTLAYTGLLNEESISNKFDGMLGVQISKKFRDSKMITENDIKEFYNLMLPFVKQYNAALIKLNIEKKETNFVTDAKISSVLAKYIQNLKREQLLKKISANQY